MPKSRQQREREREQAIAVALLSVPEFRSRAGLPPMPCGGDSEEVVATIMGVSRIQLFRITQTALRKMRRALINQINHNEQ